jgi:Family of unknown function (DUF6338)
MTFDLSGLVIFLLAVMPGFIAQQSRYLIVPRSIEHKSAIEETGDYVLNSVLIHLFLLAAFRIFTSRAVLASIPSPYEKDFSLLWLLWLWDQRWLILLYFMTSLVLGPLFGFVRGIVALKQPIRSEVLVLRWCRWLLTRVGVNSFLETDPVWYGVLRNNRTDEFTFLQIRMKSGGYYTGELRSYGLVADKEKQKDFYIVNAYFRASDQEDYRRLEVDGVLLNFADAEAIEIVKQSRLL